MKVKWTAMLTGTLIAFAPLGAWAADAPPEAWKKHCASCHGNDGVGKTKAGRQAKVKDLSDKKVQAEFTDEQLVKSVVEGISRDGKVLMKSYKDMVTESDLKELTAFVRTLAK